MDDALITIPLAAARAGLPVDAFAAEALRRHREVQVFVQPDPPGWRAVRYQADAGGRVPEFEEHLPDDVYDVMLTAPMLLTPDVLREVLATGWLHRVTIDGETVGTARQEVGYTAWSINVDGTAEFDSSSAVTRRFKECFVLCEAQCVPLESLLVEASAVDLLLAESAGSQQSGDQTPRAPTLPRDRALLTIAEAARRLRMRRTRAESWLESRGLVQLFEGRKRVSAETLDAAIRIAGAAPPQGAAPTPECKPKRRHRQSPKPRPPVERFPLAD